MFAALLWPLLAVWMGLALLIAVGIVALFVYCTMHVAYDVAVGSDGDVYCPVHKRAMRVHGAPRHSKTGVPFASLRTCERFGSGHIRCGKFCLTDQPKTRTMSFAV